MDKVLKDEKKFDVDESTFEGMLDRSVNEGKTIGIRAPRKGRSLASVPVRRFFKTGFYKSTFRAQTGTIVHFREVLVLFRP